jgi:hypothetical protein
MTTELRHYSSSVRVKNWKHCHHRRRMFRYFQIFWPTCSQVRPSLLPRTYIMEQVDRRIDWKEASLCLEGIDWWNKTMPVCPRRRRYLFLFLDTSSCQLDASNWGLRTIYCHIVRNRRGNSFVSEKDHHLLAKQYETVETIRAVFPCRDLASRYRCVSSGWWLRESVLCRRDCTSKNPRAISFIIPDPPLLDHYV